MGEFLGVLAGGGMLLLAAALLFAFLYRLGAVDGKRIKGFARAGGTVIAAGAAYGLLGALISQTFYGRLESAARVETIFRLPGLLKMYKALQSPSWIGPLSGVFAWLGHWLGALLWGQYLFAGGTLAVLMTFCGSCFVYFRLCALWGPREAEDALFLIFCLPGALFLFLPGVAPILYLLCAAVFYFAGRRLKRREIAYSQSVYAGCAALCALFSAAVVMRVVMG